MDPKLITCLFFWIQKRKINKFESIQWFAKKNIYLYTETNKLFLNFVKSPYVNIHIQQILQWTMNEYIDLCSQTIILIQKRETKEKKNKEKHLNHLFFFKKKNPFKRRTL